MEKRFPAGRHILGLLLLGLFVFSSCSLFDKKDKLNEERERIERDTASGRKDTPGRLRALEEKRERLIREGKQAPATIDAIEDTGELKNRKLKLRLYLKVKPEKSETFDALVDVVVSRFAVPHVGQRVTVYYNDDDKTDIIVE